MQYDPSWRWSQPGHMQRRVGAQGIAQAPAKEVGAGAWSRTRMNEGMGLVRSPTFPHDAADDDVVRAADASRDPFEGFGLPILRTALKPHLAPDRSCDETPRLLPQTVGGIKPRQLPIERRVLAYRSAINGSGSTYDMCCSCHAKAGSRAPAARSRW